MKLVGDWIDRDRGDLAACWPGDALAEAIAAAHQEGARVTAHCFAAESLPDLLAAGIDCVEHATGLTEELIPQFAERGVAIVPTLVNIATFLKLAAAWRGQVPGLVRAHAPAARAPLRHGGRRARRRRSRSTSARTPHGSLAHGLVAQEVAELVKAGLTAAEALSAASWAARAWLGREGLTEGASADLVVYAEDPRADVRVLADPRLVVLRGRPVG